MSPEERAAALLEAMTLLVTGKPVAAEEEDAKACAALIASAIRDAENEAENEALEKAAAIADREADFASRSQRPGGGLAEGTVSAVAISIDIRALKKGT